jgi:hypothetical protein
MSVPETPMHEHDSSVFRKNDIGLSGQIGPMQSESVTQSMKRRTDDLFGLRIPIADTRHIPASVLSADTIRHQTLPELTRACQTDSAICTDSQGGTAFPT